MRGFPFLNLLAALLLSGAVLFPLVRASTRRTETARVVVDAGVRAVPENRVSSHVSLRFVHAPVKVRLLSGDVPLREWVAPGQGLLLEDTVALPLADGRVEFTVQIEWPAGTPETVAELDVEPDGKEARSTNIWGSGGAADELITLSWKS